MARQKKRKKRALPSELRALQAELEETAEQLRTSTVSHTRLRLRALITRLDHAILALENGEPE